jgi:GTP-binding protein
MNFENVSFLQSVFSLKSLPDILYPEVAFAGRSNVGKSSLINRLVNRRNLVKTSSKPGKTQSLNYFVVDDKLYFVDLPGYGFARVPMSMRSSWQQLITGYLENRESLACVVVIIDLRHELKEYDRNLIEWLRFNKIEFLLVYTKADKLSGNRQQQNAAVLDAGLAVSPRQRIIFSAKTGKGNDQIKSVLASYLER